MSHSCPECGMQCHCSGDIEDHDTGEEYTTRCTCCLNRDRDEDPNDDDGWPIDFSGVRFEDDKPKPATNQNTMNITTDAELLAYLKAKQATIPFDVEIIASTNGWFLACDRRYPRVIEDAQDAPTVDEAIAKLLNLNGTAQSRAEKLRAAAAELLARAEAEESAGQCAQAQVHTANINAAAVR